MIKISKVLVVLSMLYMASCGHTSVVEQKTCVANTGIVIAILDGDEFKWSYGKLGCRCIVSVDGRLLIDIDPIESNCAEKD